MLIMLSATTPTEHKSHLGWAEIRHPFRPLRGPRFQILEERRTAGIDTLVLRELDRGTFSIAREWTDKAELSLCGSLELATLLQELTEPEQKGRKKQAA